MSNFSVVQRNTGHWDIVNNEGRLFRIRGGPGSYWISDEREGKGQNSTCSDFKTVQACMAYICDQLMFELVIAEGQEPTVIEAWNIQNNDPYSGKK